MTQTSKAEQEYNNNKTDVHEERVGNAIRQFDRGKAKQKQTKTKQTEEGRIFNAVSFCK